jgi:two-component system osmolarity sensor histidine kinase EnvZ
MSLFWRTFVLLALLLAAGVTAWVQTFRVLEFEPRAVRAAQQTAALVNLSRAALEQADGIARVALVRSLENRETLRVAPRESADRWEPFAVDRFTRRVSRELQSALGPDAIVARSVNGQPGLWVGFSIERATPQGAERDPFWLQAEASPSGPLTGPTWFVWIGVAAAASLLGAIAIASLINRPLRQLSFAATRIREGDLDSRLDESTLTSEIREVNRGFNRMARELARVEEDRAVMLAGISHDLRTPLARLRLETEMSVADEEAKRNMALDIDQLDAIIDKFMDYARPGETTLHPVAVRQLAEREACAVREPGQIRIAIDLPDDLSVLGDETELARVFQNLFENARRYGRPADGAAAEVEVGAAVAGAWVMLSVRDHGGGVPADKLAELTTPFFRGDTARTAATGAGLGLTIVDKAMQRMGGSLQLDNAPGGGLVARLRLRGAH